MGDRPPERVVVLRALRGLGDMLCAVPAFRALRAALPDAIITLLTLPENKSFIWRFRHYLDDFLEFPGFPGIPERSFDVRSFPRWLAAAQARSFDLAVQMHGDGTVTNQFMHLLGAAKTAGSRARGRRWPEGDLFMDYPLGESEVRRCLGLVEFLGAAPLGEHLEFPLTAADQMGAHAIAETSGLRRQEYVCVHPGANEHGRRWQPERFAQVADELSGRGFRVVLTGLAEEARVTAAVSRCMRSPAVDLTGRTGVGELAALLSHSRLVLSNDTGVSHLASALKVPSIVVFLNSDPTRWAPHDGARHRAVYDREAPYDGGHTDPQHLRAPSAGGRPAPRFPGEPVDVPVASVMAQIDSLFEEEHVGAA